MFRGYCDAIPNTPKGYDRFFAVMDSEHQSRTDRGPVQADVYRYTSLNLTGASESDEFPWLSLEQPCMAYAHGKSAGTTTLNYYVSKSGSRGKLSFSRSWIGCSIWKPASRKMSVLILPRYHYGSVA
jgi:hypothetical protein